MFEDRFRKLYGGKTVRRNKSNFAKENVHTFLTNNIYRTQKKMNKRKTAAFGSGQRLK